MIIDHTHPIYVKKRNSKGEDKYNGAYYYSKDIVKYIIPNVKTDRNWVTIRLPEVPVPEHSIVFIHNNRNPNYYEYLKDVKDCVLVCSQPNTYENMRFFGNPVLLPLSLNVKNVEKYKKAKKTKKLAFAGRRIKITNRVPKSADILAGLPQYKLLQAMADYETIYAVGLTAIQAKILGCKIGVYDNRFPDPRVWKVVDCKDAAKMLQDMLNVIDGEK